MDLIQENQYSFTNLSNINVLLGKNGSGKSLIMKNIEQQLKGQDNGEVNYVTPERGGTLTFEASVEQNLQNENWLINHKRSNQWTQFKSYIISQFRKLELLSLREIEQDQEVRQDLNYSFESIINQINSLLTNVRIKRTNKGYFEIFHNSSDKKLDPKHISSGESELIALAIE
jgi:ABC-type multidrug transport system ATPase subunit